MAKIGISEFTFGFAFLFEQTQAKWVRLKAFPVLPNLVDEGSKGWDAHLPVRGADYYYQFKLSEYMKRSNSSCLRDGCFSGPYYRFLLHKHKLNHQHTTLRNWSKKRRRTYYVAPQVESPAEFNYAFTNKEVMKHSRLIPIRNCKDQNDGKQHSIAFQKGSTTWVEHSEPTFHDVSYLGSDLETLYRESQNDWVSIDKEFANHLITEIEHAMEVQSSNDASQVDVVDSRVPENLLSRPDYESSSRDQLLAHAANLAAVALGTTLVLVGEPG